MPPSHQHREQRDDLAGGERQQKFNGAEAAVGESCDRNQASSDGKIDEEPETDKSQYFHELSLGGFSRHLCRWANMHVVLESSVDRLFTGVAMRE